MKTYKLPNELPKRQTLRKIALGKHLKLKRFNDKRIELAATYIENISKPENYKSITAEAQPTLDAIDGVDEIEDFLARASYLATNFDSAGLAFANDKRAELQTVERIVYAGISPDNAESRGNAVFELGGARKEAVIMELDDIMSKVDAGLLKHMNKVHFINHKMKRDCHICATYNEIEYLYSSMMNDILETDKLLTNK